MEAKHTGTKILRFHRCLHISVITENYIQKLQVPLTGSIRSFVCGTGVEIQAENTPIERKWDKTWFLAMHKIHGQNN